MDKAWWNKFSYPFTYFYHLNLCVNYSKFDILARQKRLERRKGMAPRGVKQTHPDDYYVIEQFNKLPTHHSRDCYYIAEVTIAFETWFLPQSRNANRPWQCIMRRRNCKSFSWILENSSTRAKKKWNKSFCWIMHQPIADSLCVIFYEN